MKITELRIKNKLTQKQVADIFEISQQNVSQWETGLRKPDYKLLKPLSKLYNCTVEDLINAINEPSTTLTAESSDKTGEEPA